MSRTDRPAAAQAAVASPAGSEPTAWLITAMPAVFVLIWSTGFVVARFAMPHAPPWRFLAVRFALSAVAYGLWVAWARVAWPRDRRQWGHLAVTGFFMHAGYLGGVWSAVRHGIAAGTVSLIVGLQPLLTAIWVSWVASRQATGSSGATDAQRIGPRQWTGLLLGFAGLVLVVWRKLGVGEVTPANLALALMALASITIGSLYQQRYVAPCDVRTAGVVQMLAAALVATPLALFEDAPMEWVTPMIGALVWSVAVLTLGGSSLLYLLLQRGAATRVTSLMYLVPPCTALLAWWLFDESLGPTVIAGMALTALGVWLAVARRGTR